MEEKETEQIVEKKLQEIIAEEKIDQETLTKTEIRKAIKGIKNNKAEDKNNWKKE